MVGKRSPIAKITEYLCARACVYLFVYDKKNEDFSLLMGQVPNVIKMRAHKSIGNSSNTNELSYRKMTDTGGNRNFKHM